MEFHRNSKVPDGNSVGMLLNSKGIPKFRMGYYMEEVDRLDVLYVLVVN